MKEPSPRVRDILSHMSLEQKAIQLCGSMPAAIVTKGVFDPEKAETELPQGIGRFTQYSTAFVQGPRQIAEAHNAIQDYIVEKTGVPAIIQNESSTGLVAAGATVFPVPLNLSATWEPDLARQMGTVIADEGRAVGAQVMMSPVVDVAREGRWGRVGETFGEDPLLSARFSSEEVAGIQGDDYTQRCASMAKHFMAYGASEVGVNCATINIAENELREVYGTPFAAAIAEHDMQSVMVTYSELNGLPMSVNPRYTQDFLRGELGFTGIAVCDGHSIPRVIETQGIFASRAELAAAAVRAGIDADTPTTTVYNHIVEAVEQGLLNEADLDACVLRTLQFREEMGLLDNWHVDPEAAADAFGKPQSWAVAREIAEKSMTLLKNEGGLLPLAQDTSKIAVVGPFAKRLASVFGGYAYPCMTSGFVGVIVEGTADAKMQGFADVINKMMDVDALKAKMLADPNKSFQDNLSDWLRREYGMVDLIDALRAEFPQADVSYDFGPHNDSEDWQAEVEAAARMASDADVIVFTAGEVTGFGPDATSGEGTNNPDLTLPGHQQAMLEALAKTGKPVVMVLFNGRALALGEAEPLCDAILEAWYPGVDAGPVVARTLSGALNPGGKLTVTVPQISSQCPLYYGTKTGSGYLRIDQTPAPDVMQPLYPFGYGLSYTSFEISNLEVDESVAVGDRFTVRVRVQNTGAVAGDETVQIYTHSIAPTINRPIKELRAFKRVTLEPGEAKVLEFTLDTRAFGYYNAAGEFVVEARPQEVYACYDSSTIAGRSRIEFVGETREILHDRVFSFEVVEK